MISIIAAVDNDSVLAVNLASSSMIKCGDVKLIVRRAYCSAGWAYEFFDVLILSEVLEHLTGPAATLRRLHSFLKKGALVFASLPIDLRAVCE